MAFSSRSVAKTWMAGGSRACRRTRAAASPPNTPPRRWRRPPPRPARCRRAPCPGRARDALLQRGERIAVTEKIRDADEQVLEQRAGSPDACAGTQVAGEVLDTVHLHAPPDAAQDGGALVVGEIVARPHPQETEDVAQGAPRLVGRGRGRTAGGFAAVLFRGQLEARSLASTR